MSRIRNAFHLAGLAVRSRVITGVAVIVPLAVTVWVVRFLFLRIDGLLQPLLEELAGRRVPGAGLLATLLLLYLVGLLVQTLGGKTLLHYAEKFLLRVPLLKDIYGGSKTIMDTFTNPSGVGFKRVVSFDYPRRGCRAYGFVTNEILHADGSREIAVFLPTTPNPTSGFLIFLPAEDVEDTDLTVEQAIKLIVSGGVILRPSAFATRRRPVGASAPPAAVVPSDASPEAAAGPAPGRDRP